MRNYINGNDIGWLLTLFALFFFVGAALALVMLILPKKYGLSSHRGNVFAISTIVSIFGLFAFGVFSSQAFSLDELEMGRHWKNDCKLIEVNIPTGTFTDSVNKLDCTGVIINVPTNIFNTYTSQWEMYNERG